MDMATRFLHGAVLLMASLATLLVAFLAKADAILRLEMTHAGIAPLPQLVILCLLALAALGAVLRFFGGFLRVALLVILLLLAVELIVPLHRL